MRSGNRLNKNFLKDDKLKYISFLAVLVIPSFLFLIRPSFIEYDSYSSLNYLCNGNYYDNSTIPNQIFKVFLDILPCDEFVIKLFILLLFYFSILCLYWLGEQYAKGIGWHVVLFCSMSGIIFQYFLRFENELLAVPLIFIGLGLFIKYLNKEGFFLCWLSMAVLAINCLIWPGTIYLMFFLALGWGMVNFTIFPVFGIVIYKLSDFVSAALPNYKVSENNPLVGLSLSLPFVLLQGLKMEFPIARLSIPLMILGIINPKFFILALPLLGISVYLYLKNNQYMKIGIIFALTLCLVNAVSIVGIFSNEYSPKNNDVLASKEIVEYSATYNKAITNDWDLGHIIHYYGGKTEEYAGYKGNDLNNLTDVLILTKKDINCSIIREYPGFMDFIAKESRLKIYNC
jgi:hypothetical protein